MSKTDNTYLGAKWTFIAYRILTKKQFYSLKQMLIVPEKKKQNFLVTNLKNFWGLSIFATELTF